MHACRSTLEDPTPLTGRDFRVEDIGGGTALGQVGDTIGTQCDVLAAQADQPVDFLFVLDNSGSMGDELDAVAEAVDQLTTQLGNASLDFRIAMLTTEFSQRSAGPTFAGNGQGTCTFAASQMANAGDRICVCELTRDLAAFEACVATTSALGGSGAEGAYGPIQDLLTSTFLPATPVGQAENAQKLRAAARVVAIFVTDAGEQSPVLDSRRDPYLPSTDNNPYFVGTTLQAKLNTDIANSATFWTNYFAGAAGAGGWDPAANSAELPMLIHGIICPFLADCVGEEDSTGTQAPAIANSNGTDIFVGHSFARDRYYTVLQNRGGVIGAIADGDGTTLTNLNDIGATITGILNTVIGQVSPYPLSTDPIASTIKVAVEGPVAGVNCDVNNVPRSRIDGFAYDANSNSIQFFGDCRPLTPGTDVVISYRTWIDGTPDPDGVNCAPPFVVVGDQCVCPADCGTGAALGAGQTCDAASCTIVCLADCGGCTAGQECDPTPPNCACACPDDCNTGAQLPPGFVCDPATCLPACAPGGCDPGDRPAGDGWVCGANCEWECAPDCGDPDILPTERCNRTTCTVECSADCNATCGGFEDCNNDPSVCACECVESASCAPGFAFDPGECDCVCDAGALNCPATHVPNLDECRCDCTADCNGGCVDGTICQPQTCTCLPVGG